MAKKNDVVQVSNYLKGRVVLLGGEYRDTDRKVSAYLARHHKADGFYIDDDTLTALRGYDSVKVFTGMVFPEMPKSMRKAGAL